MIFEEGRYIFMALTNARDILNKKILGTGGGVPSADEIPIDIPGLSATKLSVGLEEIVLDIGQLSTSVLNVNNKVETIEDEIDNISQKTVLITSPSITVAARSTEAAGTDISIAENESIVGYSPVYSGDANLLVTNAYKDATTGKLTLSLFNPGSSSITTSGNIRGLAFIKKTIATTSKKRTTKKK